jgi:mannitol-1-/sugar-/sorbitol-6-phosphatase
VKWRGAAILFDIDGTLVDSTPVVERCYRLWAKEYQLDVDAVLRVCHGRRSEDTVSDFVAPGRRAAALARLTALELGDLDGVVVLPGARDVLNAVPRGQWAAVTSGERPLMTKRLAAAGLPIPDVLVCAEDVSVGKPSPEGYLKAAAALGADPADCLVVEDAPAGIAAGRAAGAKVLSLTTSHSREQVAGADDTVADLSHVAVSVADDRVVVTAR